MNNPPPAPMETLEKLLDESQFAIPGFRESLVPLGNGHINDTFLSTWNQGIPCNQGAPWNHGDAKVRYTHQRINSQVFEKPNEVMENILRVTGHIRNKLAAEGQGDRDRRTLTVIPSRGGEPWVRDAEGGWWRSYRFIEHACSHELARSPEEGRLLGRSIGRFQNQLADLGGERLHETIPGFHNMETRYARFHNARRRDILRRAGTCGAEIDFLLRNEERGGILVRALREGEIPERVCHNDTKMNNILLDAASGEALCVIDLDTVMPGSSLFDAGDLIRTVTARAREDEQDLSAMRFDPAFFKALLEGYVSEARNFLVPREYALLCEAGRNITQIMALRFLTDYLEGDHYYRVQRPLHNLDRCRSQIALIRSMDSQWEEAEAIAAALVR
jgi:hypothetical protein